VVGPHNYREMPELQKSLSSLGVEQWELSPIKLDKMVKYPNREEVLSVCEGIYRADPKTTLIPLGKRFYGNTPLEQELYFARGITPRPAPPQCRLVGDVIYLDAKNGRGYGCSLLPHRNPDESQGGALLRREG